MLSNPLTFVLYFQTSQPTTPGPTAVLTNFVLKTTPPQTPTGQPTVQLQGIQLQQPQPQAINLTQVSLNLYQLYRA